MEALRVLSRIAGGLDKTVRMGLWSGEEQGMRGSRAYVAAHHHRQTRTDARVERLVAYLNLDGGTGRIRGADVSGPPEVVEMLREAFRGMEDLGFVALGTSSAGEHGSSDHVAFAERGIAAGNLIQDPLRYATHTWHTNLDTYDALEEQDAKNAAATLAIALYRLAKEVPRNRPRSSRRNRRRARRGGTMSSLNGYVPATDPADGRACA
jgi:carboxypeptidase Q